MASEDALALASHIAAALKEEAPQGFHFHDQVLRQDTSLERLALSLQAQAEKPALEEAMGLALQEEKDGWTLLKLLELVDRLGLIGTSPALLALAESAPGSDDRSRFLSGRACEVLLKLPLDYQTRLVANRVCKAPLEEMARFRMGAQKERAMHRPRRIEWLILVAIMALGLTGLVFALRAL